MYNKSGFSLHAGYSPATHQTENPPLLGELALHLAVLERAMCDAIGGRGVERRYQREAKRWIFGTTKKTDNRLTLEDVCSVLDLDKEHVREVVRKFEGQEMYRGYLGNFIGFTRSVYG